jgi:hypothetical protein
MELTDPIRPSRPIEAPAVIERPHAVERSDHTERALTRVTAVATILAMAVFLWTVVALAQPRTEATAAGRPGVFASAPDRGLGHPGFGPLRHAEQAQANLGR